MFMRSRKRRDPQAADLRGSVDDSLSEGIPDYMEIPLRQWVMALLQDDETNAQRIALHLKLRVDTGPREYSPAKFLAAGTSKEQLLDVVNAMLHLSTPSTSQTYYPNPGTWSGRRQYLGTHGSNDREKAIAELEDMLTLAGSAYRVNDARTGLELRVDTTAQQAVSSALAAARTPQSGSAADHLATAWKCAYGRDPDPTKAYSEAIKAVESASQSLIEPNNANATLGSMLRVIGNSPQRFSTAIPAPSGENDIELVSSMMRRLWKGQTARHGSQNPTRFETQREAEMAVHLAATLVQWFAAGLVQRTA
ncbi:hypothetical protein OG735_00380 [Streptomyces sp. NBC_01210]|uniref:hypothetical protein n=1 Tax=Streptomyces sp. NBC_01210 TaxID=2903774 RepID=UPI002E160F83|nr:hypothetical protein OG735_00380 [Streptomyces sp. NBC_01210]